MACFQNAHSQIQSRFARFPREIRLEVYENLLALTEFSFVSTAGPCLWDPTGCIRGPEARPTSNRLAFLRVCRGITNEIELNKKLSNWLGDVLLDFEDTKAMLEKLATVPSEILGRIRHVRFRATPLPLVIYPDLRARALEEFRCTVEPAGALKQLHGLNLDRLTVIGSPASPQAQYDMVNRLVAGGNGWRELRFICNTSEMLGYSYTGTDQRYRRRPQPGNWQATLNARDRVASGPSVTIYRSTLLNTPDSVLDPGTNSVYEQSPPTQPDGHDPGTDDPGLLGPDERDKELLVVVRRGAGVECEQQQLPAATTTWDTLTEDMTDIEMFDRY
ncbi:hypothetical protein B0T19DRAFT_436760 [Cercophora scortea]|uniref:Uncharacterized protein n=1 Tax=Cercophora scortea TaxID=314031 RepID=A0AAE0MLC2_9PEZI|nr:hypothetical protein B0T19DRAFT_436760 [Cercophora scortea]